ncbi:SDR family NAD(P)-dependent oxidoreductase [Leucothrix arctica]|uniref:NAD(P)-dependent oxidoreductase n=1 Tax=Leucothrix arctica TaxID=1481894 RepID=A0A317CMV7_9GAMM|nr:SDR family oxidoreductase [Leucothrix arctica]PWQ99639.1 NAD(P)-dependent oxidoreductase [Leucothrix arctica]
MSFRDKTVLITGASSGIGREFAVQLAKQGANLIITARSEGELESLAASLQASHSNIWVKVVPLDLLQADSVKTLYSTIESMNLSVDYLINNAGFGKFCEFTAEGFDTYQKMLTLNINALSELSYVFLPHMKAQNAGGIINVASIGSFQPLPYQAVYGASKAYVLSFSEALSGELLDSNVHVMALCPGTTESNFMTNANADTSKMNLMPASEVVSGALSAFAKRRHYVISGRINYLVSLVPRIVTRLKTIKIVASMFKESVLKKQGA